MKNWRAKLHNYFIEEFFKISFFSQNLEESASALHN